MASAASAAMARSASSLVTARPPLSLFFTKRLFFLGPSPSPSRPAALGSFPFAVPARLCLLPAALSHAAVAPGAAHFTPICCRVNRSGDSAYSPLKSDRGGFSDRASTEMAPLFPGCDYEHWLIVMDKPGGENATKQQMIDCYIQTLVKVLESEEEANKRLYNISCERHFGFGREIDEETSNKLEGLPGVLFVLSNSYVDVENKDYGGQWQFANANR